jgi:hypothetical protein
MPQLTIYIDEETEKRIKSAAKRVKSSVSSWVKEKLTESLETNWPKDYFSLFGSLSRKRFERPRALLYEDDIPREKI